MLWESNPVWCPAAATVFVGWTVSAGRVVVGVDTGTIPSIDDATYSYWSLPPPPHGRERRGGECWSWKAALVAVATLALDVALDVAATLVVVSCSRRRTRSDQPTGIVTISPVADVVPVE